MFGMTFCVGRTFYVRNDSVSEGHILILSYKKFSDHKTSIYYMISLKYFFLTFPNHKLSVAGPPSAILQDGCQIDLFHFQDGCLAGA